MRKLFLSAAVIASMLFVSCETGDTLLEEEPQGNISSDQIDEVIREYPEKALSILAGAEAGNVNYMYDFNTNGAGDHDDFGYKAILTGLDHMTNDLIMVDNHWFNVFYNYQGREVQNSRGTRMIWNFEYKVIYNMNTVLESLLTFENPDADVLALKGRALAVRANAYMDLIRTFAVGEEGVPYYSKGDEEVEHLARMATSDVWGRIIDDLEDAYSYLEGYGRSSKQMVDDQVVAGMLARAYMFTENYPKAAQYANIARAGYSPMSADAEANYSLFDGFQFIGNPNWMWGADITGATSSVYASFFSHMDNTNDGYAGLLNVYRVADKRLYDQIPDSDIRKNWFLDADSAATYGFPPDAHLKFRDDTFFEGDYLYMRADEFYLTEAEALAYINEDDARDLLDEFVQTRDTLFSAQGLAGQDLLNEIRFQRRLELWGEGGEWWEMKRHGEALNRDYEESNHPRWGRFNYPADSEKFWFEIPQDELNGNPEVSNP